jgi:hypothetical protein
VTAFPTLAAGPDWGTVPDWLAAVGTLAAFAVALRLLAKELAARREYEEDRRTEQARLVSTWTTFPERDAQDSSLYWFYVVVKNASEVPVHNVSVVMEEPRSPYARATGSPDCRMQFFTVAPGENDRLAFRHPEHHAGPLTLTFTDAAGRRWTRYPDGRLVEPDRPRRRSRKDALNAWIAGEVDQLDY